MAGGAVPTGVSLCLAVWNTCLAEGEELTRSVLPELQFTCKCFSGGEQRCCSSKKAGDGGREKPALCQTSLEASALCTGCVSSTPASSAA